MQINFGIIAACAPSIKSLIGCFLQISPEAVSLHMHSGADQQPSHSKVLRTFGGGPMARNCDTASGARSPYGRKSNKADLRLNEIGANSKNADDGPGYYTSIHGGRSPVDSTEEILARGLKRDRADDDRISGTGSEEMILGNQKQGIIKTTEVKVDDG